MGSETKTAKIFWNGRSQAVRLPQEFRFSDEEVLISRKGNSVILEPISDWPDGYVESFAGVDDLERPAQGDFEDREEL